MAEPGTILTAAEICFKLGRRIATGCKDWKNADAEVKERIAKIELCWAQTRIQVEFMQRIARTLDDELLETIDKVLELLATKLSLATTKLAAVWESSETSGGNQTFKVRGGKYAFAKSTLDALINDLEQWQHRFDPCWFLVMKMANPLIDEQLSQLRKDGDDGKQKEKMEDVKSESYSARTDSPLLLADDLRDALRDSPLQRASVFLPTDPHLKVSNIPFTTAKLGQRSKGRSPKRFIIDSFPIPPQSDVVVAKKDARDLARKLSKADPATFRLLRCKGVLTVHGDPGQNVTHYEFVYTIPEQLNNPRSLRQVLMDRGNPLPLSQQVQLAKDLASSVSYVHNFNFVHKSIRPENILLFENTSSSLETFLVGFENFRSADGGTSRTGDTAWQKDLYRHPSRQGASPEDTYVMQHDIFSLGVCLLEVGLPTSFIDAVEGQDATPGRLHADFIESAVNGTEKLINGAVPFSKSDRFKEHLVTLAKVQLPKRVGPKYASVVVTCLTCLESDNEDFGDETQMTDVDGIIVGVRFIEKIIAKLSEISI